MTAPRWVGVRRGRGTLVLDRETGVRHLYTAVPRRREAERVLVAQTVQALGCAVLLWYDEVGSVLEVTAIPIELPSAGEVAP